MSGMAQLFHDILSHGDRVCATCKHCIRLEKNIQCNLELQQYGYAQEIGDQSSCSKYEGKDDE